MEEEAGVGLFHTLLPSLFQKNCTNNPTPSIVITTAAAYPSRTQLEQELAPQVEPAASTPGACWSAQAKAPLSRANMHITEAVLTSSRRRLPNLYA